MGNYMSMVAKPVSLKWHVQWFYYFGSKIDFHILVNTSFKTELDFDINLKNDINFKNKLKNNFKIEPKFKYEP